MDLPYRMYDADNHLYETTDAFTRHLPDHRRRELFWVTDERGHRHIILHGCRWDYIPNPTFDPVSRAGALTDMYAGEESKGEIELDGFRIVEPLSLRPEYQDPQARIQRMDQQGVEAAVVFPTLVSGMEEWTRDDVKLTTDLLWAFNRWLEEQWSFAYQDRIFTTPIISLADPDEAVKMLAGSHREGHEVSGRSPLRPVLVPVRGGGHDGVRPLGRERLLPLLRGLDRPVRDEALPGYRIRAHHMHGRAISDFLTAMVCHGALTRHPKLRVVSVENGSDWVRHLIDRFKMYFHRYPGSFPEDPVAAFQRCVWMSPFWEERLSELTEYMPIERVMAGSDFPHAEGLSDPTDFVKGLLGFSPEDERRVMRDNLRLLLSH